MFDALSDRLSNIFQGLRGRGKITEENVAEAMRDIRTALLEADVSLDVAREFCDEVQKKAIGAEVIKTLQPGQVMAKIVYDELIALMGPVDPRIPFVTPGPTVLLMAGLQGSGKTTTCAKMARLLQERAKRPLMVAADLKRPAAIDQLEILGQQINVPVYAERGHQNPVKVCVNGIAHARKTDRDVVILDTAGRLAIDDDLMAELAKVASSTHPHQIYLVLDSMTGQDAVHTAKVFNERLELDGIILTKFDSDTRGGAALTVKKITGKPIKFIGTGEKIEAIEEFRPERVAGRILGMGDILSLVEKAQKQFDQKESVQLEAKMAKGKMTLDDFAAQLRKIRSMGPMGEILKMIPGMKDMVGGMDIDENELTRVDACISSMTLAERANPKIIDASRRRRIAKGAGCEQQDVSQVVKMFEPMRVMMQQMSGLGVLQRMKMATQLSKSMASGIMPRLKKGTTATQRQLSKKDKKRRRKR